MNVSKYYKKIVSEFERTKLGIIQSWDYLWDYYRYINVTKAISLNKNTILNIRLVSHRNQFSQYDTKKPNNDLSIEYDQIEISDKNYDSKYLKNKYKITR